jgi:phospholipase C
LAEPNSIPQLHPDGPKYMGPRVPSFILSPYVSSGKVDHTIYDHTSILKTILVHNRAKLPRSVFGSFGERVNQAAHFGQALDLQSPRQSPLPFDPMRRRRTTPTGPFGEVVIADEVFTSDTAPSGPPPIPPRSVTILPRSAPLEDDPEEPDFHTSLRGALKPRG